jgi:hypothetical protein
MTDERLSEMAREWLGGWERDWNKLWRDQMAEELPTLLRQVRDEERERCEDIVRDLGALHQPVVRENYYDTHNETWCSSCDMHWPCETSEILRRIKAEE